MLKKVTAKKLIRSNRAFAIVASCYNGEYVNAMLRAARTTLKRSGAGTVRVYRVPGAYEIPVIASRLAQLASTKREGGTPKRPADTLGAIICLGVILRGETTHAAHIGEAVSAALMQIQVGTGIPVIHEVLLLENREQARVRCLDKNHNRGTEAAQTALTMAELMPTVKV